ncbi:MAG: ABC transporter ATP-binding protein [Candidatus Heimdallarchaeota archaeon]|nr:ABC transporter ATP-binding protein [Candidatus Heimdallarchaeota archaeon]MCK4878869.1 ABC transporter ATP-binding protein [Candidatus Heimdallarchaeota archaeon]
MSYKKWFFKHLLREKLLSSILLIFLTIYILTVSITPFFIGDIFGELVKENSSFTVILRLALFIALAGVIRATADFIQSYMNEVLAHKVTKNVTEEFYNDMLEKSQEFHDRVKLGDVMARATYDTRQMNIFISPGLKFLFEASFTFIFSVSFMLWISPKLTLLLAAALPFYIITVYDYYKKLGPVSRAQVEQNSIMNTRLQESITGIRVIRNFVKEEEEIKEFDYETDKLREINTKRGIISAKYYPISITILVIALSFLWGANLVTNGSLTLDDLVTFVFLMMTLTMPTWQAGRVVTQFQIGMAAAKRIYEMKEREEYVPEPSSPIEWSGKQGIISFENVSFSYNSGSSRKKALDNINLQIPGGSTIATIGNPGSGKSTLIKLLMRLYDPTEGKISIDGIDIKDMCLSNLRGHIGVIEQEVFLFSKSIRDNIAYGKADASLEEIQTVAKLAHAHEFITSFEGGYDTVVGERGVTLSGGQKQRIAIARALLVDPTILILDDASSAIDAETERKIQTAIANVLKNRTTFIITHRLATIKNADLIIVMRNGKLMDSGKHDELILRNTDYRNLFERFSELPPMKIQEGK